MFRNNRFIAIGTSAVNVDHIVDMSLKSRASDYTSDGTESYVVVSLSTGKYLEVSELAFRSQFEALADFITSAPSFIHVMDRKQQERGIQS
jgi:hypothetical protein